MRCLLPLVAAAAASTITPEQASKLRSLGYRASEIAAIRPSVASVVARRGLPRPKAGMPPSWVVDDADLAPARARPRPLAGVVGLLQKLAFSVSMLARDLAEVTRRAALPVGVVLVASQADRIRSTIAAKPSSGEAGYFLYDGPTDPAMRGGAKVRISPASAPSSKR